MHLSTTSASLGRPLVAHIIRRLDYGGMESVLVDLINGLEVSSTYRHVVICLAGYTDFRYRIQSPEVEVFDLGKREGKDLASYWRLWQLLRKLRPSIVNTYNIAALDTAPIARLAGCRVVHAEHGWTSGRSAVPHKYILLRRWMRPFVDRFIVVSDDLADWLRDDVGMPANKVLCIHNGVNPGTFDRAFADRERSRHQLDMPRRAFVVGTVARLDPVKAQTQLVHAIAKMSVSGAPVDAHLYIVGEGSERQRLENTASELGVADRVHLAGARDDVPEWLAAFDVFALPSTNEGISIAVLEAMAAGLPVVATRVGGNPEVVIDEQTGYLVPVGDVDALTKALDRYRADPALAKAHGSAGQARMRQEFSLDAMIARYRALYDALIGIHPGLKARGAA
ncbi:hypothetical protein BJI67_06885 [Acidihalobacter aeolianus]|uniref:Glycosyltransferase subfamily 4-like N-terminal domain-containing protein n=1 Tax=Acidihalobacter aeolianus TaxID=2792603 RepID=A0A1D8K787_9GAMM|nr:TIGR03088 family PEP-CTERM/XrtA system glycosyltransferase [Acidihalobacter aeolianus]AOV16821.1 hypothetical protein BJI67_06885 [Acidihalobacter aeolianus]